MKAQVAVETLTVFAAVFAVLIFALGLFSGQIAVIAQTHDLLDAFTVASTIGSAINEVSLAGNNATASVSMPRVNATISIYGRDLTAKVGNSIYAWTLFTNLTDAANITAGDMLIRNSNGVVSVENV